MTATKNDPTTRLILAAGALALIVMGLGGAVIALKVRPSTSPAASQQVGEDALSLLQAGRVDEARDAFEQSIKLNPRNWFALVELGYLLRASDPARAEALLMKGAVAAPAKSKASAYIAVGDLRLQRRDFAGAKTAYLAAVADDPLLVESHVGLGKALEGLGDLKGALKQYREAAKFAPGDQDIARAIERVQPKP